MKGGTLEPENPREQQCEHCGLYFSAQGVHNHQRSCPLEHIDARVQPLDDPVEARTTEPSTQEESPDVEVTDTEPDVSGAESPLPDPEPATDGGNPAFDGPEPEARESVQGGGESDAGEEPDTLDCPACGADTGASEDDVKAGKTYRCTECRGKVVLA
ncbi:hypothetical protein C2R22_10775 [Salinigranum rubrum]|uniref:Uncharacterized protein n=1 Tax=Salinigranum rubrum TaxID=755307 RepID=A0A2I8VJG4_9EURY|nr:hypothetical protein [Salinigranum rubrum]AUV82072.1 hypothetical protein C2R22_10775 [Salinigranum rubrum]